MRSARTIGTLREGKLTHTRDYKDSSLSLPSATSYKFHVTVEIQRIYLNVSL